MKAAAAAAESQARVAAKETARRRTPRHAKSAASPYAKGTSLAGYITSVGRLHSHTPGVVRPSAETMRRGQSSKFTGVTWNEKSRCWRTQIYRSGRMEHIGLFQDEVVAARAYDAHAVLLQKTKLNFPSEVTNIAPKVSTPALATARTSAIFRPTSIPAGIDPSSRRSRFRGVFWDPRGHAWTSHLFLKGVKHALGSWGTEQQAAQAYDECAARLLAPGKFTPNIKVAGAARTGTALATGSGSTISPVEVRVCAQGIGVFGLRAVGVSERFPWSHPGTVSNAKSPPLGETSEERLAALAHGFALMFVDTAGSSGRERLRTMVPPAALLEALRSGGDIAPRPEHWSWYANHTAIDPPFGLVCECGVS